MGVVWFQCFQYVCFDKTIGLDIDYQARYLNSIRQILDKTSICWELEQILGSPKSPHIISDFVSKTKSTMSSGCLNNP